MTTHPAVRPRRRPRTRRGRQHVVAPALRTLLLCLEEARPVVQVVVLLRLGSALVLAGGLAPLTSGRTLVGVAAWLLASTAVYLFNGLRDVVADRANGKGRPLADGRLDAADAWLGCAVLAGLSLLLALSLDPTSFALVLVLLLAGVGYSWRPVAVLRHPVAPVALILVGGFGSYLMGARLAGHPGSVPVLVLGAVMAGWMALVGGLLKDLPDVEGDRTSGRRTVAVVHGRAAAAAIGARSAVALAGLLAVAALVLHQPLLLAAAVLGLAPAALGIHVARRTTTRSSRASGTPYARFMAGQYAAHAALLGAAGLAALLPGLLPSSS